MLTELLRPLFREIATDYHGCTTFELFCSQALAPWVARGHRASTPDRARAKFRSSDLPRMRAWLRYDH